MGTVIVGIIVFGILAVIIVRLIVSRRKGKTCAGCPGCGKC